MSDLPAISNWWEAILLPLLTWFISNFVYKRESQSYPLSVKLAFIGGLVYGSLISNFFSTGLDQLSSLMGPGLLVIALFLPIYKPEYVLGFVISMFYTFGAVLPIGFACVVAVISFGIYRFIRPAILYLFKNLLNWLITSDSFPAIEQLADSRGFLFLKLIACFKHP